MQEPEFPRPPLPKLIWNKKELMEEAKNGTNEIVSPSGFTKEAFEYAEKYRPS
jgi:hypothetical protein